MNLRNTAFATLIGALAATALATPAFAQDKPSAPKEAKSAASAPPSDEDMAKMMALAQPNENHKLLGKLAGEWNYQLEAWFAPGAPPTKSSGTANCTPLMDGRYYVMNTMGKFQMPGPDGQMQDVLFKGMAMDAYDNVKQKFISTWIDNMGTSILVLEGTYDPAAKTFTYQAEEEDTPGVKKKVRELIKLIDQNHYTLEWYEGRGGEEAKTMEIKYTRQG